METQEQSQNQNQNQNPDQNPNQETKPDSKMDKVAHFASLLGETSLEDDDNENDDPGENNDDDAGEEIKLESFDDLAKSLKVDKAKLYGVKLKLRESGKEVTLGELKDHYQEYDDIDFQRLEWGNERKAQELELANARKEIEVLASLLPKDALNKEKIEAARKIVNAQLDRSRADLLKRVPEWNDVEVRKADITKINDHLKDYGLSFSDISDSRIAHYIRNNWLREQTIEKALAKVRPAKKQTAAPSRRDDGQSRKSAGRKVSPRARHIARHLLNEMD